MITDTKYYKNHSSFFFLPNCANIYYKFIHFKIKYEKKNDEKLYNDMKVKKSSVIIKEHQRTMNIRTERCWKII